jgi:hypothetical protein
VPDGRGTSLAQAGLVSRHRPTWTRGLRLYDVFALGSPAVPPAPITGDPVADRVHARSRFRSVRAPGRFALYSLHDGAGNPGDDREPVGGLTPGDHTLVVVREFRRVPLHASALALLLLTAHWRHAPQVVAALAHEVERAVSLYQPSYLLLARSLEEPRLTALLTGVHECDALQAAKASAFSLDTLMPELDPMLEVEPEWYAYCPESALEALVSAVSPV